MREVKPRFVHFCGQRFCRITRRRLGFDMTSQKEQEQIAEFDRDLHQFCALHAHPLPLQPPAQPTPIVLLGRYAGDAEPHSEADTCSRS